MKAGAERSIGVEVRGRKLIEIVHRCPHGRGREGLRIFGGKPLDLLEARSLLYLFDKLPNGDHAFSRDDGIDLRNKKNFTHDGGVMALTTTKAIS